MGKRGCSAGVIFERRAGKLRARRPHVRRPPPMECSLHERKSIRPCASLLGALENVAEGALAAGGAPGAGAFADVLIGARRPDGTSKGFSPDKEWEANAWVFAPEMLEEGVAAASDDEAPSSTAAPSGAAAAPGESAVAEAASPGVGEQPREQGPAPAVAAAEEPAAPEVGEPWHSDPEEQWVPDAFGSLGPSGCAGAVFCSIA
jgi:hypothetical protein